MTIAWAVRGTGPAFTGQYSSGSNKQVEARFPSSPTASVSTQTFTPVFSRNADRMRLPSANDNWLARWSSS
jgi:hypothetical protein